MTYATILISVGKRFCTLYKNCCQENYDKFIRTLLVFVEKVFSKEQIDRNLDSINPIPFLDDDVKVEGAPGYEKLFEPGHEKWDEYCKAQKDNFIKKFN